MINFDDWQLNILETKGNLLLVSGRQVGKSTIISIKAGNFALENSKKSIMVIASVERQAQLLFEKILSYILINNKSAVKTGKHRPTKHKLQLKNGSVIHCLPTGESGYGIRGFTIDLLIADEAAFIPEDVWVAVTPMLATTGGDIILLSTPFGKEGYFARCFNDERYTQFHVNSEKLFAERPIDKDWTKYQRETSLKHLEHERARMTIRQYAQEYLGEFVDELMQFFPDSIIKQCMKTHRKPIEFGKNYYLGVDIARMGEDESTFEILEKIGDRLVHVENIITKKTLTTMTTRLILKLDKQYNFRRIYIDDGGLGVGVFDQLIEDEQTRRKVIGVNNLRRAIDRESNRKKKLLKEDLYNNLLRLMEQNKIQLLDDPVVFQSLKSCQYEYTGGISEEKKLKIFGNYTHVAEGIIRAAWCVKDKSLNISIGWM